MGTLKKNLYKLGFTLPALTLVSLFFIIPNILNFYFAFTDWTPYRDEILFRGFRNFIELTQDKMIWRDLWTTLKFALSVCIIQNFIALCLALALEKDSRFNTALRTIFFIPVVFSPLAVGYIFRGFLNSRGTINTIIQAITNSNIKIPFLGNVVWTIFVLAFIHSWHYFGINMLVYIAGLRLVPNELIEAAMVEGARGWSLISKIKIPLIIPSFTFNIVVTLVGTFSAFVIPLIMTKGGPGRSTEVLNIFVFQNFGLGRWSFATAIGLVIFILVCIFAIPMIILLRKREVEL